MKEREERRELSRSVTSSLPSTSKSVTPTSPILSPTHQLEPVGIGEHTVSDYFVPSVAKHSQVPSSQLTSSDTQVINCALLARIELLEAKNAQLKMEMQQRVKSPFRLENIQIDDKLISFYTGFVSLMVFLVNSWVQ